MMINYTQKSARKTTLSSTRQWLFLIIFVALFSSSTGCHSGWLQIRNTRAGGGLPLKLDFRSCLEYCQANKSCYAFNFYHNQDIRYSIPCWPVFLFNDERAYKELYYIDAEPGLIGERSGYAKICIEGCNVSWHEIKNTRAVGGFPFKLDFEACKEYCLGTTLCYGFDFYHNQNIRHSDPCWLLINDERGYKEMGYLEFQPEFIGAHTRYVKVCD